MRVYTPNYKIPQDQISNWLVYDVFRGSKEEQPHFLKITVDTISVIMMWIVFQKLVRLKYSLFSCFPKYYYQRNWFDIYCMYIITPYLCMYLLLLIKS